MDTERMFEEACLLQLSVTSWNPDRKINSLQLGDELDEDWFKRRKVLINPNLLKPIKAVAGRARAFLRKHALPFPVTGLTLIPLPLINKVQENLEQLRREYQEEIKTFLKKLPQAKREARDSLGTLYNDTDYPLDIGARFRFQWRFLTLNAPGQSQLLSPSLYAAECEKFRDMMEEARLVAMKALRAEFAGLVNHMVDRLSGEHDGKPKRFKASMLENLQTFLAGFDDRNIFDDTELEALIAQAKTITEDVSPDLLRNNNSFRDQIASEMAGVKAAVDDALVNLPIRKVRLAA